MKRKFTLVLALFLLPLCAWSNIGPAGFKQFKKRIFVETGSYSGNGIQLALSAGFQEVHSMDINPQFINNCKSRFQGNPNVHLYLKDSSKQLGEVIAPIKESVTFWLDAHNGWPDPNAKNVKNTPLIEELEQIKHHPIKTHTILIDDLHCCKTLLFDYLTLDQIIAKVLEINPYYTIFYVDGGDAGEYKNNVLVAYIPE